MIKRTELANISINTSNLFTKKWPNSGYQNIKLLNWLQRIVIGIGSFKHKYSLTLSKLLKITKVRLSGLMKLKLSRLRENVIPPLGNISMFYY